MHGVLHAAVPESDLVTTWTRAVIVAATATAVAASGVVALAGPAQAGTTVPAAHSASSIAVAVKPDTTKLPLQYGDTGAYVRELQRRLAWVGYPSQKVTNKFDAATRSNVKAFQAKWLVKQTGIVNASLWNHLFVLTKSDGVLPKNCRTASSILCINMSQKVLRWVVKGKVIATEDVRFGSRLNPTRVGSFHVYRKDRTHVSSIYHTSMPDAMFFSGGQAVHYSSNFNAVGYKGASHGCVNERSKAMAVYLFNHISVGTKVFIYR
jgi:L,D-transpeptidase catalytic domain/Putative peptidoglycan binding domain